MENFNIRYYNYIFIEINVDNICKKKKKNLNLFNNLRILV